MYTAFVKLLNMSAAAGILIPIVIALRYLLRRSPKKYICILWALVAVRLVCPFSISSALSAYNYIGSHESSGQVEYIHYNGKSEKPKAEVTITLPAESEKSDGPTVNFETKDFYIPTLLGIWAFGASVLSIYAAVSYYQLRLQVRESLRLRRGIYLCDHIPSPFILGILRPKIYLPSGLDSAQQQSVIAHERAHLARLDHLWKPLGYGILCLHWFNPQVWLAYWLLCRDIELACDEKVIQGMTPEHKREYAELLLSCSMPQKFITACPLAFGEAGVKERIRGIARYKKPTFLIAAVSLAVCFVLAALFLLNPVRTEDYLQLRHSETKFTEPHVYDFRLQTGRDVRGPIITVELWQHGELMQSAQRSLPDSVENLTLTLTNEKSGDALSGCRVQLAAEEENPLLDDVIQLPEGAVFLRDYGWHGPKDIPLNIDQDVLLGAFIYEYGSDGYFLFSFDNGDYRENGSGLREQDCVILVYAEFWAKETVSREPEAFTQVIYQFGDSLPAGYTLEPIWPYYAGLYKDGERIGRISELELVMTDGQPDIPKTLGFTADYPASCSITGSDPDWEVRYADGKDSGTRFLHRVNDFVYELVLPGEEVPEEVRSKIVPDLRAFLNEHPDAFVPTYTYILLTGEETISSLFITRADHSGGYIISKDALFTPRAQIWLEPLEGMYSIAGITLRAVDENGKTIWKYTVPENQGTAQRIQDGDWVLSRDCPEGYPEEDSQEVDNTMPPADIPAAVMVNGILYFDTKVISITERCGMLDGTVTAACPENELPTEDNQSNFGTGYGYQYTADTTIEVLMADGHWHIFAPAEADDF